MANIIITGSININQVPYLNNDIMRVENGSTVTVDTDQVKYWQGVNLINGTLRIENTSSNSRLRFLMGRASGATANIISGSSGLGIVEITGSWIYLDSGTGLPNQTITQPYTDSIPAVWVETSSGSGDFEPWLNLTSQVGEAIQYFKDDLGFAYTGSAGKFFIQQTIPEPYPVTFTGSISSSVNSLVQSGVQLLYTSSLYFGRGGVDGNVIPSESRVRIPNILVTDVTALNVISATSVNSANFVGTSGCVFRFNTVLFDESYGNFLQPQVLEMKNCAWSEYPLISECYSLTIDNVAMGPHPVRRTFGAATGWITRDLRWGTQCAWSYISNAVINRLYIANHGPNALFSNQNTATAATTANTPLYISYTNDLTANEIKIFQPYRAKNFQYGMILFYANQCTFTNTEIYGCDYFNIQNSAENTFINTTGSVAFSGETPSFTSTWRIGIDPNTNESLVLGQPYYIKTRCYRSWQNPTGSYPIDNVFFYQTGSEFVDSIEYSFTPYTASHDSQSYRNHPDYFGAFPTGSSFAGPSSLLQPTASLTWIRREPVHNNPSYEIYRYTSSKSPIRNSTTLQFTTNTSTTVAYVDTASVARPMAFDTPYYYVLRKYDSPGVYSESDEQIVTVRQFPSASNLCWESNDFTNARWIKRTVTASANAKLAPNDIPIATSAANSGDSLYFSSSDANIYQPISQSILSNSLYNFSIYVSSLTSSVSCSISASSGTYNTNSIFVVGQRWQRLSLPFSASSGTASVGIFSDGRTPTGTRLYGAHAQINSGSNVAPYIPNTGTTALFQRPMTLDPTYIRMWSRGDNGSGAEIAFATPPAGTLWWELHVSTASNFTPSARTKSAISWPIGAGNTIYMSNASNNVFNGFKQQYKCGYGCTGVGILTLLNASSNNRFLNFDLDYNYACTSLMTINTLANNNFIHNWRVNNYRNYIAANYPIIAVNNAQGLTIQNLYSNNADIPLNNLNLDVELKNVSAANGRPITTGLVYTLAGSTTDQNAIAYGQVYDTIFNEFLWNSPSGSMHLNFNASVKTPSPYSITGSLYFSNTGRLYFNSTGSIEYEWPWRIYGISGFRSDHLLDAGTTASGQLNYTSSLPSPFCNSVDLGANVLSAYCLKKEFAYDTGSGYGPYSELTGSNPAFVSASIDPSTGFNFKVKLTARPALLYDGQLSDPTSSFIIGEYITGSTSRAIARVVDDEDRVSLGTLILSEITGSFRDNEWLLANNISKSVANGTGSIAFPSQSIFLPQPTSYIAAMQWYTVVNTASLYPISTPMLTLTGLKLPTTQSTRVDVITQTGSIILDEQEVYGTTYSYTYDYFQDTPVYIVIQNLGYQYLRLEATLTEDDLIIPVEQTLDRNYYNPTGS